MLFLTVLCAVLAHLCRFALADIDILKPTDGQSFTPSNGNIQITLQFSDNGQTPAVTAFALYTVLLCTGANDDINCFYTIEKSLSPASLKKTQDTDGNNVYSYTLSFSSSTVGDGQFYLQVSAKVDAHDYTLHYSPRFSLSSMKGLISSYTYSDDVQPTAQYVLPAFNAGGNIDSRSFTVPYTLQTGTSRFAPMQQQPNTTVTKTTWSNRYPTSAVTYYSTFRKSMQQMTTITPGWSYTFKSDFNYATAAACPSDNGGWYNPSKRQTLSVRKVNG